MELIIVIAIVVVISTTIIIAGVIWHRRSAQAQPTPSTSSDPSQPTYNDPSGYNWPVPAVTPTTTTVKKSYTRGAGTAMVCPSGTVNENGLCYQPAQTGYKCSTTTCVKDCPYGFTDNGLLCAKTSTTRGAGTIPSVCPTGMEKSGDLCYPKCNTGYVGVGPVCWETCPTGYTDTGTLCTRPADTIAQDRYARPAGTVPQYETCKTGYTTFPLTCTKCTTVDKGYYNYSWGCVGCYDGNNVCRNDCYRTWIANLQTSCDTYNRAPTCAADEENINGLCYKKCKTGYSSSAGDILYCTKDGCPTDYTDTGLTCYRPPVTVAKNSYGRTAGTTLVCPDGKVNENGLCYTPCPVGTTGEGPLCWKDCPTGYNSTGTIAGSCTKPLYQRPVGTVPNTCPPNTTRDGALCYPACSTGYSGVGPVCWENFENPQDQNE